MVETVGRKEQILQTAYEIAGRRGLEHVHARTIGAELSINHAAVHYYFKTRTDLMTELTAYVSRRFEKDLIKAAEEQLTPARKLEAHIALYEAYAKPQSRFFKVFCSLFTCGISEAAVHEELVKLQEHMQALLLRDLDAAKLDRAVNGASPFANVEVLSNELIGLCVRAQTRGGIDPTEQIDRLLSELIKR